MSAKLVVLLGVGYAPILPASRRSIPRLINWSPVRREQLQQAGVILTRQSWCLGHLGPHFLMIILAIHDARQLMNRYWLSDGANVMLQFVAILKGVTPAKATKYAGHHLDMLMAAD
jgi:hypothetical protein